jgi:hypothetical protein
MWALTAAVLASVQLQFIGEEDGLLALGCCDWRVPRILAVLDMFFDVMEEKMQEQPSEPPHKLSRSEMRELKVLCKDCCHRLDDLEVPNTIAHGDFSPHNVIVSDGSPILLDWAEAYVAFPFISWEYFKSRMVKDCPERADWQNRMAESYTHSWVAKIGRDRVGRCLQLSPAIAVLVSALYGIDRSREREHSRSNQVKRSLMRRLQRELQVLTAAGAL